jgi:hypothetical protein
MQICFMQKQLDEIKIEVTKRIRKEFQEKFNGNKTQFAKKAGCDEKSIRLLLDFGQGMTLNLLFKLAYALDINPSDLIKDLHLKKED